MEQNDALFIAELLTDELKEETRNYNAIHSSWVEHLIKATKGFYEDNEFYMLELERLIKEYYETKEWYEKKCQED